MGALPRPDLPPGPQRDLVHALHDLHHRAGWPSLRTLAREAGCSHTTVSHGVLLPQAADLGRRSSCWSRRCTATPPSSTELWLAASTPNGRPGHHRPDRRSPRRARRRTPPPRVRHRPPPGHRRGRHRQDRAGHRGGCRSRDVRGDRRLPPTVDRGAAAARGGPASPGAPRAPHLVRRGPGGVPDVRRGRSGPDPARAGERGSPAGERGMGQAAAVQRDRRTALRLAGAPATRPPRRGRALGRRHHPRRARAARQPLLPTGRDGADRRPRRGRGVRRLAHARPPSARSGETGARPADPGRDHPAARAPAWPRPGAGRRRTDPRAQPRPAALHRAARAASRRRAAAGAAGRPPATPTAWAQPRRVVGGPGARRRRPAAAGRSAGRDHRRSTPSPGCASSTPSGCSPRPTARRSGSGIRSWPTRSASTWSRARLRRCTAGWPWCWPPRRIPRPQRSRSTGPPPVTPKRSSAGASPRPERRRPATPSRQQRPSGNASSTSGRPSSTRPATPRSPTPGCTSRLIDAVKRLDLAAAVPLIEQGPGGRGGCRAGARRGDPACGPDTSAAGSASPTRPSSWTREPSPCTRTCRPVVTTSTALHALAGSLEGVGRFREAAEVGVRAVTVARRLGIPSVLKEALADHAWNQSVAGDTAGARATVEELTAIVLDPPDPYCEMEVAVCVTDMLLMTGAPADELVDVARTALTAADTWGLHQWADAILRCNVAEALVAQGDPHRAWDLVAPLHRGRPRPGTLAAARATCRARAAQAAGPTRPSDTSRPSRRGQCPGSVSPSGSAYNATAATIELWSGQPAAALDRALPVLESGEETEEPVMLASLLVLAARAAADLRDRARGEQLRDLHRRLTGDPFAPHPLLVTPAAQGATWAAELARLEGQETVDGWVAAAAAWDRLTRPYDAAYCRWRARRWRWRPTGHGGGPAAEASRPRRPRARPAARGDPTDGRELRPPWIGPSRVKVVGGSAPLTGGVGHEPTPPGAEHPCRIMVCGRDPAVRVQSDLGSAALLGGWLMWRAGAGETFPMNVRHDPLAQAVRRARGAGDARLPGRPRAKWLRSVERLVPVRLDHEAGTGEGLLTRVAAAGRGGAGWGRQEVLR